MKLFTREVCLFKNSLFLKEPIFKVAYNAGIEIRTDGQWKPVVIEKKSVRKIFFIIGNGDKMRGKYLLRELWTPITLNHFLLLTQHDKWLTENIWKTLQTWCCGLHSSIKKLHFEKILSFLFWNWKQCPAMMKLISVMWCQIFSWFYKQVQNLRFLYKNVPCLFYSCYTQTPWVMSSVVVNTLSHLRFP